MTKVKKNITKDILLNKINSQFGLTKVFSEKIINELIFYLIHHIKKDKIIKIKNFGTFKVLKKNERIGRNPKTREEFLIRGRNVIVFKSSKTFLNKLNK